MLAVHFEQRVPLVYVPSGQVVKHLLISAKKLFPTTQDKHLLEFLSQVAQGAEHGSHLFVNLSA